MQDRYVKEAMIHFVQRQLTKENNQFSATQWLTLMNSYFRKEDVDSCAKKSGLGPIEVSIAYCGFSIAISEMAIRKNNHLLSA